jgi:hypothetical protein
LSPVAGFLILRADPLGHGAVFAVPLVALLLMLGAIAGIHAQLTQRIGATSAILRPRVGRDLPHRLVAVVVFGLITSTVLLPIFSATGSADDTGRAGRSLHFQCGYVSGTSGSWPGSFYVVPLAIALIVSALTAVFGLRRVVFQPRVSTDLPDPHRDDHLRLRAASSMLSLLGVIVFFPLAFMSLVAATTLSGTPCKSGTKTLLIAGLLGMCIVALLSAGYCIRESNSASEAWKK